MQLERVRKNHMDVEWHEYTDENGKKYSRYKCEHHGKGFHYRTCRDYVFILWNWSMESPKLYECPGGSNGDYLHHRYRADVH